MKRKNDDGDGLVMTLAGIAGLLLSLCVLLSAKIYNPTPYEQILQMSGVEKPLPYFVVENLSGELINSQQFEGKGFLLFFGDPGCPACQSSYPALRRAQGDLPILFISRGDRRGVVEFVEKEQFTFPVIFDSSEALSQELDLSGVPNALLINRDGMIVRQGTGGELMPPLIEYAAIYVREEAD